MIDDSDLDETYCPEKTRKIFLDSSSDDDADDDNLHKESRHGEASGASEPLARLNIDRSGHFEEIPHTHGHVQGPSNADYSKRSVNCGS